MNLELTGAERRYLLKKVKADIQSGNATSVAKLTMLYDLEKKLTAQQAQKPEEISEAKGPRSIPILRWILDDIEFGYDAEMIRSKILHRNYQCSSR